MIDKPNCNKCTYQYNCPCGYSCCNAACLKIYKPTENNHKLGIKIPPYQGNCAAVQIYIDRERVNSIGLYQLSRDGRRIDDLEKMDLEFDVSELEVKDINGIALAMNEETFNKFCELWRGYHNGR